MSLPNTDEISNSKVSSLIGIHVKPKNPDTPQQKPRETKKESAQEGCRKGDEGLEAYYQFLADRDRVYPSFIPKEHTLRRGRVFNIEDFTPTED